MIKGLIKVIVLVFALTAMGLATHHFYESESGIGQTKDQKPVSPPDGTEDKSLDTK